MSLRDLLTALPKAVEAQLGRSDSPLSRDPQYHFARFGGTRLKRDGTIQIGRRDRKVLEQVASGAGDRDDPVWQASAAAALDKVTAAHMRRLPAAIAGDAGKEAGRGVSNAALDGVGIAGTGGLLGATPAGEVFWNTVGMAVNNLAQHEVMTTQPTTWQTAAALGAAGTLTGAMHYLDERTMRQHDERAVSDAWTQAHGADVRGRLGISLPAAQRSSVHDPARVQHVTGTAQRLAELTGSDPRTTLSQLAALPAADRQPFIARSLVPDLPPQRQEQVIAVMNQTRGVDRSESALYAGDVDRAVGAVLKVDAEHGGSGRFADVFPNVDPARAPQHLPGQTGGAALSGLSAPGSARPAAEAAVARRAGAESGRTSEGRTGPNG